MPRDSWNPLIILIQTSSANTFHLQQSSSLYANPLRDILTLWVNSTAVLHSQPSALMLICSRWTNTFLFTQETTFIRFSCSLVVWSRAQGRQGRTLNHSSFQYPCIHTVPINKHDDYRQTGKEKWHQAFIHYPYGPPAFMWLWNHGHIICGSLTLPLFIWIQ